MRIGVLLVSATTLVCTMAASASAMEEGPTRRTTAEARVRAKTPPGGDGVAVRRQARPSPLVTPAIRSFVFSRSDFARSARIAAVVVPLVLLLLAEREAFAIVARRHTVFLAFIVPLLAMVVLLLYVRLRVYAG